MTNYACLVIDVQTGLIRGAYQEQSILSNINLVISKCRSKQIPIVFIQHCHTTYEPLMKGAADWAIHSQLDRQAADTIIEKQASDAFYQTPLKQTLNNLDINHLVITGMQSEYCVDATCRSALSHDFDVSLVKDAHTTGNSRLTAAQIIEHHNTTLANLAHPHHTINLKGAAHIFS